MENYSITSIANRTEDGIFLNVQNSDGVAVNHPVYLSTKQLKHSLNVVGCDVNTITAIDLVEVLLSSKLVCKLEYKSAGDTYEADEYSQKVIDGEAKVGQMLEVEKDGIRIVRKDGAGVSISPDMKVLREVLRAASEQKVRELALEKALAKQLS